ncbi:MAG: hypothetical protein A2W61_01880 [Deltaproteobacteria bacterium RIFCSPLOWO2_01_44_7]|nr:MAG: hypothetical protein A2W61_01880 [Deltaproteobacteria bacterium RIFCSPLOWO2_01_44_7]
MTTILQKLCLPFVIAGLVFFFGQSACTKKIGPGTEEVDYVGVELFGDTYTCKSNKVASGGFWNKDMRSERVGMKGYTNIESETTTWRIVIKNDLAHVTSFSGSTQTIEEPKVFQVEKTSIKNGLLLVSLRDSGVSPEIITIDPENGSFVYSTQHINLFHNRASVFYGECYPYQ